MILESVGVPNNIINVAREVYDRIFFEIGRFDSVEELNGITILLRGDFKISDYNFKSINVTINLDSHDKIVLLGMSYQLKLPILDRNKVIKYNDNFNKVGITFNFALPENTDITEFMRFIEKEKTSIVVSITHELKHAYDIYKKPHEGVISRAEYVTVSNNRFSTIEPYNLLLYQMYFIKNIENLVRPSEFASELSEMGISKKEFYNFITNSKTFKILNSIRNLTLPKFKNNLLEHIEEIKEFITNLGYYDVTNKKDEEIIDESLRLFFVNFVNWNSENLRDTLTIDDPFSRIFGNLSISKTRVLLRYVNNLKKYADKTDDFYLKIFKDNSEISNKMIKKISKVFSLIDDKEVTNESIIDWELWHQIKRTKSKIVTEFKKF